MLAFTATRRLARLRSLALTGLATTGAATAALTLVPTAAHAAEAPQAAHTVAAAQGSRTDAGAAGSANNLDGWIKQSLAIMKEKGIPG
ncbi:hypothetical protein ABZ575_33930, partial [Streptomyces sp. NPDC018347]